MKSLLISRCLMGDKVRFDGGDCLIAEIEALKQRFSLIPICPEVMAGLPIPREPIEILEGKVITQSGDELTALFDPVKKQIRHQIEEHDIKYALFKEHSPSCGVNRIFDGSFSAQVISGSGIITHFLRGLGVRVYSEHDISDLLAKN